MALTIRYLIGWSMTAFIYFTVTVGLVYTARESILSSLNTIETIVAGLVVLAPMGGLIYDLFETKNDDNNNYQS